MFLSLIGVITMSIINYKYYHSKKYINEIVKKYSLKPKTKIKEVIKYIEKEDSTETWKLIQYLNGRLDKETSLVIANAIENAHKKYGLPKKLIIAIIKKESNINPLAKSKNKKGEILARGLMQIYAKWHPEKVKNISLEELYHIDTNIDIGCKIFREYYDISNGDLSESFHKYLSKRASKSDAKRYMDEILKWWATLEMYEYSAEAKNK
jgi:soluble lytic murein transglycosylase-like protein